MKISSSLLLLGPELETLPRRRLLVEPGTLASENYTCSSQDTQDTKHIFSRAIEGKNSGICPRVNLYQRFLEGFGAQDGGIDTHEFGSMLQTTSIAYFETPLYLRQRLPEVCCTFTNIFSDGFISPPYLFSWPS